MPSNWKRMLRTDGSGAAGAAAAAAGAGAGAAAGLAGLGAGACWLKPGEAIESQRAPSPRRMVLLRFTCTSSYYPCLLGLRDLLRQFRGAQLPFLGQRLPTFDGPILV